MAIVLPRQYGISLLNIIDESTASECLTMQSGHPPSLNMEPHEYCFTRKMTSVLLDETLSAELHYSLWGNWKKATVFVALSLRSLRAKCELTSGQYLNRLFRYVKKICKHDFRNICDPLIKYVSIDFMLTGMK